MKQLLSFLLVTGIFQQSFSQYNIKTIHPLFQGGLNGDSIRKHYESAGNSQARESANQEPHIRLEFFHSNAIFPFSRFKKSQNFEPQSLTIEEAARRLTPAQIEEFYLGAGSGVSVYDSTAVIVIASGINRKNASKYEFRAVKNDTQQVLPWSAISLFCEPYTYRTFADGTEETEVAYLGEFRENIGNKIRIEVRNKQTQEDLSNFSASWRNIRPEVIATFSDKDMPDFLHVYRYQWKNDFTQVGTYYGDTGNDPVDSLLVKRVDFAPSENNIIFYLSGKIKSKELLEYRLLKDRQEGEWITNNYNANLVWVHDLEPGKYTIQIRYSIQRQNVTDYAFVVQPAWHQTLAFKIIGGILFMVLFSFGIIMYVLAVQRAKTRKENLQKRLIESEIKSIRSQFNPHFVFNSISSIQALITTNNTEGANQYLTAFSTLMRDSLNASARENSSLTSEIKMLNSYLKLEKLRFGFEFIINLAPEINPDAIEIPSLLLQPVVENAVKHGLSPLYEKGILNLDFTRQANNLVVTVNDNGAGFDTNTTTTGFGIRMTNDRIQLLNSTYQEQFIVMTTNSTSAGTTVQISFNKWFV